MKNAFKLTFMMLILSIMNVNCISSNTTQPQSDCHQTAARAQKMRIQIVLGSTRPGRSSDKIGNAIKSMADKRKDAHFEIVDLRDYTLPFLKDEVAPASRKTITDPAVKKWSDKISKADGFIFIVPEYNAGYPGVLKNALDSLYKEWNHKPVALIGYSGGSSGGVSMIAQLRQIFANGLEMLPVEQDITIPSAWKAFDTAGNLVNKDTIEIDLNTMINEIIDAFNQAQEAQ